MDNETGRTADQGRPVTHFSGWSERIGELRTFYHRLQTVAGEAEGVIGTTDGPLQLGINGAVLERETFRIMVLGEFSSGKSTLINALLGKKLLPTKANPATAFTTVLRWGERERAWLYRSPDRKGGPTEVTVEEFKKEVSLQIDANGAPREPSFALAVVEQPLGLLRNSVEIVDSAGINESADRERVTLRYLEEVDAVIYVTDAGHPFTLYETEKYLEHVRRLGHRDIFFVVNQFDRIEEEERAEVMSRCRNTVAQLSEGATSFSGGNVFFVSALGALKARMDGDEARVPHTGLAELERALADFCMRDAARVKFVRLAEFLRHNAINLRQRLHDEGAILMKSTAELRELLDRSQATQDQLRGSVDAIRETVNSWISDVERQLQMKFATFLKELSNQVPSWDVPLSGRLKRAGQVFTRGGRDTLQHELREAYTSQLQRRMQQFCTRDLESLIQKCQAELLRRIEPLIRAHTDTLEGLRTDITGARSRRDHNHLLYTLAVAAGQGGGRRVRQSRDDVPLLFRPSSLMAIGAGTGAAIAGGTAFAATAGVISLGLVVPPLGVAAALGAAVGPLMASGALIFADGKVRARTAQEFAGHVRESAGSAAQQYANSRAADLRAVWGGVAHALSGQLQDLIGSVQRNIVESRFDEQTKRSMRDQLYVHEQRITEVEQRIGEFLQPFVTEAEPPQ